MARTCLRTSSISGCWVIVIPSLLLLAPSTEPVHDRSSALDRRSRTHGPLPPSHTSSWCVSRSTFSHGWLQCAARMLLMRRVVRQRLVFSTTMGTKLIVTSWPPWVAGRQALETWRGLLPYAPGLCDARRSRYVVLASYVLSAYAANN